MHENVCLALKSIVLVMSPRILLHAIAFRQFLSPRGILVAASTARLSREKVDFIGWRGSFFIAFLKSCWIGSKQSKLSGVRISLL
jgi:hypothetical protein